MTPIIVLLLIFFVSIRMRFTQVISEDDFKHFGDHFAIFCATNVIDYSSTNIRKKPIGIV